MGKLGKQILAGLMEYAESLAAREASGGRMKEYGFTIELLDFDVMTLEMADAIYEAGCDDSSCSSSCGVVKVAFDREAESLEDAVSSAVAQVMKATKAKSIKIHVEDDE